jgi:copper chaperone NosL
MKIMALSVLLILLAAPSSAQMFQTVPEDQATLLQEGPGHLYCPNCGMHLVKFYRTGHALKLDDGSWRQYCSLHCLAEAQPESMSQAQVVDQSSLGFIPVSNAFYVVGSDAPGTMTMQSKYAFADEDHARLFQKEHGGQIMSFAKAASLASGALEKENQGIARKRAKMASKGQAIFEKMCEAGELPAFTTIAEAKTYLHANELCQGLDDGQLQAVALYLILGAESGSVGQRLMVPADAKCPICGMFVAKYPKWAASMQLGPEATLYFDGVKDMMKFYQNLEGYESPVANDASRTMLVTDYYTLAAIDARQAWYVEGSNVYGPMGNELIPFASRQAAETFKQDHAGQRVLPFDQITPKLIRGLD